MKHGLIKVAAAIPAVKVADTKFNLIETEKQIAIAEGQGVEIYRFPRAFNNGLHLSGPFPAATSS